MPLAQDPNKERHDFFRDLAQMPLTRVQDMLESVNFLTPAERQAIERRRDDLLAEREQRVRRHVDERYSSFKDKASRVQEEADALTAELDQLIADGEAGKVTDPAAFAREYERLEHRLNNVNRTLANFDREAESIERIEGDPEAWLQNLERRFRQLPRGVFGTAGPIPGPEGGPEWTTREE